ncbi:MAG: MetQ/NlpA family ABC transporter substrate-binding protein [Actinomycetaceae bacterium]|nr:MetQ/NlpA family ABC transporter substrate-binding protein [Actinomycetaceae bacterium]
MRIKKGVAVVATAAFALGLSACGNEKSGAEGGKSANKVVVAASPVPHAEILKFVATDLAPKHGYQLEVKEFNDYVQPNEALKSKDVDANYFQTVPYLKEESAKRGYDFEGGKGIHLEPLGIYSKKVKDLKQLKAGDSVGIIQDVVNQARALKLLEANGIIKLPAGKENVSVADIKASKEFNPKGLQFQEVDGPQLARSLEDVTIAVINGNYAQGGGLVPKAALALESPQNNPAVNILVWRKGEETEVIKKLDADLHSQEVKDFITKKYPNKDVIAAF